MIDSTIPQDPLAGLPGSLTAENVDVYVLRSGVKIRLYQSNLDAPKFFMIRTENGKNRFPTLF